jgi:hypothetical protein
LRPDLVVWLGVVGGSWQNGGMTTRQSDPEGVLPWQTGDLVLAADRRLYTRADPGCKGFDRWPWGHEGSDDPSVEEEYPKRPLTLLVRGGKALGGVVVDDSPVLGAVVRSELGSG